MGPSESWIMKKTQACRSPENGYWSWKVLIFYPDIWVRTLCCDRLKHVVMWAGSCRLNAMPYLSLSQQNKITRWPSESVPKPAGSDSMRSPSLTVVPWTTASATTVSLPLYRSTCVSRHLQLRTGGFCWCNILLPTCPCWLQPVHSD